MRHLRISSLSTEYVRIPVATLDDAGALADPTGDGVEIAFTTGEDIEPGSIDDEGDGWEPADWETSELVTVDVGATRVATPYKARLLVGPDYGTLLDDGEYTVWVKVTTGSETPVRAAGRLIVS
jgi:hypothetical protein